MNMPAVFQAFNSLSDTARVFVFGFNRRLTADEEKTLRLILADFTSGWKAHDEAVSSAFDIYHSRFAVIAGEGADIGGCAQDSLTRIFKEFKMTYGADALDRSLVFYHNSNEVICEARYAVAEKVSDGSFTNQTPVFDNTISSLGELRSGLWQKKAGDSWHKAAFSLS